MAAQRFERSVYFFLCLVALYVPKILIILNAQIKLSSTRSESQLNVAFQPIYSYHSAAVD